VTHPARALVAVALLALVVALIVALGSALVYLASPSGAQSRARAALHPMVYRGPR
jgi:hypothetical protein